MLTSLFKQYETLSYALKPLRAPSRVCGRQAKQASKRVQELLKQNEVQWPEASLSLVFRVWGLGFRVKVAIGNS